MKKALKRALASVLCLMMVLGTLSAGITASADSYSVGDTIYYGTYPQTEVTDSSTITALNNCSGTWVSYGYYSGSGSYSDGQMAASDYMRYKDVSYNGEKYRAVTFDSYRPCYTGYTSTASTSSQYQQTNGYTCGNVYWFKYEPIKWRVLDPSTGLVMCATVIDSQAYNNYIISSGTDEYGKAAYWGDSAKTYYANNYAESSIREWLNNDFYNTAFSDNQKSNILTTTLDNSAYSTSRSAYDSVSTSDKVYLLSYSDILNSSYGFATSTSTYDTARQLKGSDYAKAQGLSVYSNSGRTYDGCSGWRLRSAGDNSDSTCRVIGVGCATDYYYITISADGGVVPALNLQNLKSDYAGSEITVSNGDGTHSHYDENAELIGTEKCTYTSACTATCTDAGKVTYTCTVCGYTYTETIPTLGHSFTDYVYDNNATCTKNGTKTAKCDRCDATDTKEAEDTAPGHKDENEDDICDVCGENIIFVKGYVFEYGTYPQSLVTDETLIAALNNAGGVWLSYGYYSGTGSYSDGQMAASDYMRYKDVSYNGEKYRAVTFDSYRPYYTGYTSTASTSYQYQEINGYTCGNVYWFKYEPIKWRVLDPETGLVICDSIIDSQPFNNYIVSDGTDEYGHTAYWGNSAKTYYADNYAESSIREWLNNDFYNTAFSDEEKANIITTTIDNSAYSTSYSAFSSASVSDKVYLLSYSDVINSKYGFAESYSAEDTFRQMTGSDYAKAQGLYVYSVPGRTFAGCSCWRLRSADLHPGNACGVDFSGDVGNGQCNTDGTDYGIVPALNLKKLKSDSTGSETTVSNGDGTHTEYDACGNKVNSQNCTYTSETTAPTCTEAGKVTYTCTVCGYTYTETISATGHTAADAVKENEIAPTCTENGSYESVVYCSVCNAEISRKTGNKIPALGHLDADNNGYCDRCGEITNPDIIYPCRNAKINATGGTVDYKTKVNLIATATGVPAEYCLAIYEGNTLKIKGSNTSIEYSIGQFTSAKTYTVKVIDADGNVQTDENGNALQKDVVINVNAGFFKKLIAFFKGLFGLLPTVTIKP